MRERIVDAAQHAVCLIQVYESRERLFPPEADEPQEPPTYTWNGMIDRTCVQCNGRLTLKCPQEGCSGGTIKRQQERMVQVHPLGQMLEKTQKRITCPTCKGHNQIDCNRCDDDGVDGQFN